MADEIIRHLGELAKLEAAVAAACAEMEPADGELCFGVLDADAAWHDAATIAAVPSTEVWFSVHCSVTSLRTTVRYSIYLLTLIY